MKNYLTRIKKSFILGIDVKFSKLRSFTRLNVSDTCYRGKIPFEAPLKGVLCYSKTFTKPNYVKLSAQKIAQKNSLWRANRKRQKKYNNYSLAKKIPIVKGKFENSYLTSKTRDLTESECQILTNLVEINQGNIPISWEQFYLLTDTNFFTFNQTYKKY